MNWKIQTSTPFYNCFHQLSSNFVTNTLPRPFVYTHPLVHALAVSNDPRPKPFVCPNKALHSFLSASANMWWSRGICSQMFPFRTRRLWDNRQKMQRVYINHDPDDTTLDSQKRIINKHTWKRIHPQPEFLLLQAGRRMYLVPIIIRQHDSFCFSKNVRGWFNRVYLKISLVYLYFSTFRSKQAA